MKPQNVRQMLMSLHGAGDPAARLETLSRLVIDLLVEVEALREAVVRLSAGTSGGPNQAGHDFPRTDETLAEGKSAYPAAYVDAAYLLHNAAGPTDGAEKLLARFYPANGVGPRETLMLRRLGFTDAEIRRFLAAAEQAETFS